MLQPQDTTEIPDLTRQVAHAAFPDGSLAMVLRDQLGPIFADADFADLYPALGQPAVSPARLALVTVLQFVENLPDRQAADAVRARIDWKYALGLELTDPGFHYSVLSEFRQRLVTQDQARLLLEKLLARCAEQQLLKGKHMQRTDSTHVLAAIRSLSLLELVGETMRRLLNDIARVAPEWLRAWMPGEWIKRYARPFDSYRLPTSPAERAALAAQIGADGFALLDTLYAASTPPEIRALPLVEIMRRIWLQQFYRTPDRIYWRTKQQWGQPPPT